MICGFPLDLEMQSFTTEWVILWTRKVQSGEVSDLPKCIQMATDITLSDPVFSHSPILLLLFTESLGSSAA